jgi:hypothetical protein
MISLDARLRLPATLGEMNADAWPRNATQQAQHDRIGEHHLRGWSPSEFISRKGYSSRPPAGLGSTSEPQ